MVRGPPGWGPAGAEAGRAGERPPRQGTCPPGGEELEQLKVVLRLCQDVKAFQSFKAFEHATTQVVGIAKQNEGWLAAGLTARSCQDAEREVPVTMDHPEVLPVVGEQRSADTAGAEGDQDVVQQRRQLRPPTLVPLFDR